RRMSDFEVVSASITMRADRGDDAIEMSFRRSHAGNAFERRKVGVRDGVVALNVRVFCLRRDGTELAACGDFCIGLRIGDREIEASRTISTESVNPELMDLKGDGLSPKVRLQHRIVRTKRLDDELVRFVSRSISLLRFVHMHAQTICFE